MTGQSRPARLSSISASVWLSLAAAAEVVWLLFLVWMAWQA